MKSLINSVRLMGNVGNAPNVKTFDNGNKVARLSMATNHRQKKETGEYEDITYWHNLVIWGKLAEIAEKYIQKGTRIAIEGVLTNRDYKGNDNEKKNITEIKVNELEFIGSKNQNADAGSIKQENPWNDEKNLVTTDEDALPFD